MQLVFGLVGPTRADAERRHVAQPPGRGFGVGAAQQRRQVLGDESPHEPGAGVLGNDRPARLRRMSSIWISTTVLPLPRGPHDSNAMPGDPAPSANW